MSVLLRRIKRYSLAFVAPSLVRHVDSQFSFSSILSFEVAHTVFYPLFFIRFTLCLFTSNFSFVDFHRHRFPLSRSLSLPLHPFFSHLLRLIQTNIVDSFSCGFFSPDIRSMCVCSCLHFRDWMCCRYSYLQFFFLHFIICIMFGAEILCRLYVRLEESQNKRQKCDEHKREVEEKMCASTVVVLYCCWWSCCHIKQQ